MKQRILNKKMIFTLYIPFIILAVVDLALLVIKGKDFDITATIILLISYLLCLVSTLYGIFTYIKNKKMISSFNVSFILATSFASLNALPKGLFTYYIWFFQMIYLLIIFIQTVFIATSRKTAKLPYGVFKLWRFLLYKFFLYFSIIFLGISIYLNYQNTTLVIIYASILAILLILFVLGYYAVELKLERKMKRDFLNSLDHDLYLSKLEPLELEPICEETMSLLKMNEALARLVKGDILNACKSYDEIGEYHGEDKLFYFELRILFYAFIKDSYKDVKNEINNFKFYQKDKRKRKIIDEAKTEMLKLAKAYFHEDATFKEEFFYPKNKTTLQQALYLISGIAYYNDCKDHRKKILLEDLNAITKEAYGLKAYGLKKFEEKC